MDLFPGFETARIAGVGADIHCRIGGEGPPLLLLHGYPQCHATWHRVAPELAKSFRCVVPDLRGYGASSIPGSTPDHVSFSKRTMAEDFVAVMSTLGHETFAVVGHDRGARVTYRLALDHPERVTKVGIVEVVTTADMWANFDAEMGMKAYHWPFLAQPHPLPETMIGGDPIFYLEWMLSAWTQAKSLDVFDPAALDLYRKAFADPERVRAMCDDYRAGAGFDRVLDEADRAAGRKITAPLHFIWAKQGFPALTGDPMGFWREWCTEISGTEIDSGHFGPEENPQAVLAAVQPFLAST